ncbi:iron-siderophore ABC transporter substrate-binding protein [Actinoplanes bogorensis]|uniref:Iron-siderophore ABC transporter substrate-binding protein n=1 Tax=Paractinoplanes bogorensis TaxID=1610840 RepID=A0ABS5YJL8_9ACTN|nr:iron-siderophore ABC transporter substrate-binding protein [Actinoplanes bogorensis]MBU2663650.1 iron-siderophore ABC transporter substrate-binding protein [Actinoplanes bogorensis]
MITASLTRRSLLTGALLMLAGCSSGSSTPDIGTSASTRTVPGGLGTIEVPAGPQRVVAVGQYRDLDAAIALGVVPLLSPDLSFFLEGGVAPWVQPLLGPAKLNLVDVEEMPYEAIAALKPDLILATDRLNLEEEYARLSQIAPTMSWDEGYNKDEWRTTTTRVGAALGKEAEAAQQIKTTEDAIAQAKAANPEFAGKTFTLGPVTADGTVNTINSTSDASAEFLAQFGLALSPAVTSLPNAAIPGRAVISPERLDVLDADVLMLTFNTPAARTKLEATPLFQQIPAVRRGAYVGLDLPAALAIGFPSALSVRYGIEQVLPKIKAALARPR